MGEGGNNIGYWMEMSGKQSCVIHLAGSLFALSSTSQVRQIHHSPQRIQMKAVKALTPITRVTYPEKWGSTLILWDILHVYRHLYYQSDMSSHENDQKSFPKPVAGHR